MCDDPPVTALSVEKRSFALPKRWLFWTIFAVAAIVLRVVYLQSDPYPGLSWSSALLTDEGFYIHNARNVVLFGRPVTDQFNNMLIMPVLHFLQLAVFRVIGVGSVQARLISIVLSLAALLAYYRGVRITIGSRAALVAVTFLALDHISFLYNRLALMDSPASDFLVFAFYLWAESLDKSRGRKLSLQFLAGLVLVATAGIRGLAVPAFVAPLVALAIVSRLSGKALRGRDVAGRLLPTLVGVLTGAIIYVAAWYAPHSGELHRVNKFYSGQLLPRTLQDLAHNCYVAVFGDGRGLLPYMLHHSPVATIIVILILPLAPTVFRATKSTLQAEDGIHCEDAIQWGAFGYATAWLASLWFLFVIANYSPSRYFVLSYPALGILVGWAVERARELVANVRRCWLPITLVGALCVYHAMVSTADRVGYLPDASSMMGWLGGAIAILVFANVTRRTSLLIRLESIPARNLIGLCGVAWLLVNVGWTGDWLTHLTYRQRTASRYLARTVPEHSVLFGALAPGLCLDNRLQVVPIIEDLCNDNAPLNRYHHVPKYVVMLDDNEWREQWWLRHYSDRLKPKKRIAAFPHMLRQRFIVGVYAVND